MGQFRDRFTKPTYITPYQYKKDDDEYHQYNGGRDWYCSFKKRETGRGPYLPALVEVAYAAMYEQQRGWLA